MNKNGIKLAELEKVITLNKAAVYQNKHLIVNNITMNLHQGEFAYLIGKTGSGKSSLLKTLYGELPLLTGTGTVAGFDLHTLAWENVPMLRRKLGIIFQDFNLLTDRTVEENLKFVLRATDWKDEHKMDLKINDLLHRVGLSTKKLRMPHELSGGEQQRVALARCLVRRQPILLLDEPYSALDSETRHQMLELTKKISTQQNLCTLLVSHNREDAEILGARVLLMNEGTLQPN